ncbi:hypothetical protein DMN91_001569 [Ooceraea biroi]|uniref:Uncharacterized protein n=1 Tax=Ooceraea biroi TaxID=2015173 RepID=A0A3L8DYW5_OOCBI|nr:uncharacterized protein LOC105275411 [Ooceraea biroi]RLU25413.1 hypothetical protein DMN91_001569 [Ooceraea biroi]
MADKTKLLTQKRTSLKSQVTNLSNLVNQGRLDPTALRLRMARLTALYHAFEDYNDELAILEPDGGHNNELVNIQDRFYAIAGRVENILNDESASSSNAGTSSSGAQRDDAEPPTSSRKRRLKLPEASLPTFDGKYENWLSFKNAFNNMIDAQADLTDVDKLHYLRSALVGEAASKVRLFAIDGINYRKAWEVLERS